MITLTTDFGYGDPYIGAVKGVIQSINRDARVEDVAHDLPKQDTHSAAFVLSGFYRYWPAGTIHLMIIDPGVGSSRLPILVETENWTFVGPDNGIFSAVYRNEEFKARHLTENKFFLDSTSDTFHGRDIFGPVASYLSLGVMPEEFGPEIENPVIIDYPVMNENEGDLTGEIIYIDSYGNLVSNIRRLMSEEFASGNVNGFEIKTILKSYNSGEDDSPFFINGSSGFLEISVKNGSAQKNMDVEIGAKVVISKK